MCVVTPAPTTANRPRTHHSEVKNAALAAKVAHNKIRVRILAFFDSPSDEK